MPHRTRPEDPARRHLVAQAGSLAAGVAVGGLLPSPAAGAASAPPEVAGRRVLRYAFPAAETSLDPVKLSDLYSRTLTAHIFEALYTYDHLARPARVKPLTAAALPEHTDDYRVWTVQLRPGIFFADDPAFGGRRRELVAADYVYALERFADPALKSPVWSFVDSYGLEGLAAKRQRAIERRQPYDYAAPVAGLRALDRHTLQFRLQAPRPRFIEFLAESDLFGAVAREVVDHYGPAIDAHPVGTGPFKLAQWRRGSLIRLVRNPGYRERRYDAEPAPDDAQGQAILARLRGRLLPLVDEVEVAIVEEAQPRWLAFLNGQHDLIENVPADFVALAMPHGRLAPHLAHQGVQGQRNLRADCTVTVFNMADPVVGGLDTAQVALRRALSLGLDVAREIQLVYRGQAVPAQASVAPHTRAYDPRFRSEMSHHDPARARALLDLHGFVDRDGDGWRERPDGSPLRLEWTTETTQRARQQAELWQRDLTALGVQVQFRFGSFQENLKAARAGRFMVWGVGGLSASPDSQGALQRYDGTQIGGQNLARFDHPEVTALYQRLSGLPDGPQRDAVFREVWRHGAVWMPYRARLHTLVTDLQHRQVTGYRRPLFWQEWWHMVDVAPQA
ncbi:ABC transporter substrate-binding protein [Ideonella livida]|uniref:Bicyclomycin resistance protein n=1 Tax=Ideonella livida TaxID=2707176 RepID=A0A7C9PHA0_9BURK|nr:ABC transporter substrate-binding protein [Ideonella livida]NDY91896.1 bicyclomycin resistance protein [Ideonella livida]